MKSENFKSERKNMITSFWHGFGAIDLYPDIMPKRSSLLEDRIKMSRDAQKVMNDLENARRKVTDDHEKKSK